MVTALIDPAKHEAHTAVLHCRDAKAPSRSARCSLTRTGFQFPHAKLSAQLYPGKSILLAMNECLLTARV